MKKKYKRNIFVVIFLIFLFACFLQTEMVCSETLQYTKMIFYHLFPSAFIFLLLSQLLFSYHLHQDIFKIFHSKGLCFFLMSLFSGFPSGSVFIKEALKNNDITLTEANQMIQYAHFPNPIFVIYQTSKLFPNSSLCFIFYGIIVLSNFLLFLFSTKKEGILSSSIQDDPIFSKSFIHCSYQTISILFTIYTSSLFFYLISCFISKLFVFSSEIYVFIMGIFDLTNGVVMVSILTKPFLQGVYLLFFIIFGSIPIHIQVKSILSDTVISYPSFLKGRIKSFLFAFLFWIIYSCCTLWIG